MLQPLFSVFSFFCSVIPTGMADFFFRAAVRPVGHGVEGPWQHFHARSAVETGNPFWTAACPERGRRVALPPLLRPQLNHSAPLIRTLIPVYPKQCPSRCALGPLKKNK